LGTATAEATIPGLIDEVERLFRTHHGLVFRVAYRITGNATDAEDVLQTVFLRLMGRDESARPLENCESYLRRAAINAALDVLRARRAAETLPLEDSQPDPRQPDRRELRDCLRRSLASLNPEAAQVFALRFFEGHSNPEIARMLGISQVRVAVTVHRTRRQLQKEMRSYMSLGENPAR
jgi:RNA polymerase sigma-70 factor (ECF subfamily)